MLRDVAERLSDDADDRALEVRVEVPLVAALLHLDLEAGLPLQIVDEPRDRRGQAKPARRALPK